MMKTRRHGDTGDTSSAGGTQADNLSGNPFQIEPPAWSQEPPIAINERVSWNIPKAPIRLVSKLSETAPVSNEKKAVCKQSPTVRKPAKKRQKKPYRPRGYYWRSDSAGWELRRSKDDGYIARMSGRKWQELRRQFNGPGLEKGSKDGLKRK